MLHCVNPCHDLSQKTYKENSIFYHFWGLRWYMQLKSYPKESKGLFILHIQYHGCWWPGDVRSQGIGSHNIELVTLGPRQNGRYFPDNIFKCIFLNENVLISIKISLKFVPMGPINNIPALVQIMAWRRPGDKPLSEPMPVSLLMHICVTGPQWDIPVTAP